MLERCHRIGLMLASLLLIAGTNLVAADKPNVIFILADDLGYGDLGCFGQKLIQTPHIDRLAAEGMRFTQAYAGATVCAPSRCSLMTGLHNGHAPVRGNREHKPEGQFPMPAETVTVAHMLKKAGYRTGIIGKWGLGYPGSVSTPEKMGFDYFFGYNCQREAHEYYPQHLWRNTEKVMLNGKKYSHDLLAEEALTFVRESSGKADPFFLYLALTIPHQKLQVPDIAPYADRDWPDPLKKLAAMVTRMDGDVGRLMALLKELKIDDNTLVFFASDNGAAYRDELFKHSGPLRGNKRDMYEGGIRTPAIARWPGHVQAGVVNEQVWCFYDLFPTLADLVGQPTGTKTDGISFLPALLKNTTVEHPPLYWEFHERGFFQAARMGHWKAVKQGKDGPVELYDLETDLAEKQDVASSHLDVVARFTEFLKTARTESVDWPITEQKPRRGNAR